MSLLRSDMQGARTILGTLQITRGAGTQQGFRDVGVSAICSDEQRSCSLDVALSPSVSLAKTGKRLPKGLLQKYQNKSKECPDSED